MSKLLKEDAPSLLRLNLKITIKICDSPRKSKRGVTRPDHVKTATVPNRKMRLSSCPGHIFFSCRARLRVVVFTGGQKLKVRAEYSCVPTRPGCLCMAGSPARWVRAGVESVATGLCLCLFDPTHQQALQGHTVTCCKSGMQKHATRTRAEP